MSVGKWIGGLLGFVALGPLGALAGLILGSMYDDKEQTENSERGSYAPPYQGERNGFLFSMLVMASYIIRADGKIMHSEMEYVRAPELRRDSRRGGTTNLAAPV